MNYLLLIYVQFQCKHRHYLTIKTSHIAEFLYSDLSQKYCPLNMATLEASSIYLWVVLEKELCLKETNQRENLKKDRNL